MRDSDRAIDGRGMTSLARLNKDLLMNKMGNHYPASGASTMAEYQYVGESRYAALEYYTPGRSRTHAATLVLGMFASMGSFLTLSKGADQDDIFESYDLKLWSYNDHLVWFTLATIPSVAGLATLFAAYQCIDKLHTVLSR